MGPDRPPAAVGGLTRRRLLATAGAVSAAAALAGCGAVSDYEFTADPVVLPPDERDDLGYVESVREPVVEERTGDVGGVDVEATVESRLAVYEPRAGRGDGGDGARGNGDAGGTDGANGDADDAHADGDAEGAGRRPAATDPHVGAVSTPRASVAGRSFNPLARRSLADVLASEAGGRFLERVGLGALGFARSSRPWVGGPVLLDVRPVTCLGESTTSEAYAGLLAGDPPTAAYVHLLRVEPRDVLLAAAVHGRDVDDRNAPVVGRNGSLSRDEFDAAADRFARACAALRYG